jgi:hypothetical protein
LPGFDPNLSLMRYTRDFDVFADPSGRSLGFLGRAHPLVLRAIKHGCRLPGTVACSRGDALGLLLTFELEIRTGNQTTYRHIVAVMVRPGHPPTEITDWLSPGSDVADAFVWPRLFACWAAPAQSAAEQLVGLIASERHAACVARYDALAADEAARTRRWLHIKADLLCGSSVRANGDLFGAPEPGPAWRYEHDSLARLAGFATDAETPKSKRREANDTIEMFRARELSVTAPGPIVCRPIGMLMVVPKDAI